ncbi:hypothetical protein CFC21_081719 [Triticum aestivum]|uniref:NB-ARC domain-containing protein n=2 Tax=Triticum aestivum TaxID=4565 RepID=A0A9R1I4W1_WHEAT|nr:uncharacterized protein LOC123131722 [Triticum aestivum]KAF7077134.1 hypothetical protein CFC21_081719 [Triticum aestivum]
MPKPKEINIQVKSIDAAAGETLDVLEDTSKGNVIFVRGWHGFGASATLKAVAQRLKSSKSNFDRVVHVDCSLWKSMRALQKSVAEELELPPSVMAIFDRRDEEDDFSGIDEGSRGVIPNIRTEIFRKLASSRFVVIFHNGSDKYIDLYKCGVPVTSVLSIKVLWTWHGRFQSKYIRLRKRTKMELHTDVVVNFSHDDCIRDEALLEEAKEIVAYMGIPEPYMNHIIVDKCFQYAYALGSVSWFGWGNWEDHVFNYFVCDGIIQGQGDSSAWGVADALQRNMSMDWLRFRTDDDVLRHLQCRLHDHLLLVQHKKGLLPDNIGMDLSEVTSCFILPDGNIYYYQMTTLPDGILQHSHSSKLRVLHLSWCGFSFESPPFLCCSQLRLLQLKNCRNIPSDKHPSHNEVMSCFQKLWVLHLRSTNWYRLLSEEMMNFMVDLRELTVEEVEDWSISDLRGRGPSLVKVHVEEQGYYLPTKDQNLPDLSSASFLKAVILINCVHVEQVVPGMLPPLLESFTFSRDSYTHDYARISRISFRGCSQLKSILLQGDLGKLEELDLSGTAVKTLDLRELEINNIKFLILLGCEKLYAILWPLENKMTKVLEVMHIDTTRSTSHGQANWEEKPRDPIAAVGSSSILVATATELGISQHASFDFKWYISLRDTRILRSLEPVKYNEQNHIYMEMGSSPTSGAIASDSEAAQGIRSLCRPDKYLYSRGIFFQFNQRAGAENEGAISWMSDCPAIPTPTAQDLYVHIQDNQGMKRGLLQQQQSNMEGINTSADLTACLVFNSARMLHVHDSSSITCITCPQGSYWRSLEWCRVERCPELRTVFRTAQQSEGDSFCHQLSTFWASQLLKARYIWYWSAMRVFSSVNIVLLHLDYCPRLIHVLPLSESVDTLPCLDTLEIVCCGDLREIFALDPKQKEQKVIQFPKLRRIHLYELPSLRRICGSKMSAPNLETIKIRGCWSLKCLPAVSGNNQKLPSVDCEKEWWDNLELDGVEANHHSSLYEHSHSSYYKAQLPRGTVLR